MIAAVAALVVTAVVVLVAAVAFSGGAGPATLVVRSEPRGAAVFVDGKDSGERTPALIKGVRSGEPHKVRLELEGHVPLDEVITIEKAGSTKDLSFTLTPEAK